MVMKAWVASHTGLPSIYSDAPVRVETVGGRVLADGSGPVLLSDALAEPGVPTTYTIGGTLRTLTRATGPAWGGLLTTATGRGVPGLIMVNNEDSTEWKSTISRFSARSHRWSLEDNPLTGTALMVLTDPAQEPEMWDVVRRRSVLVIGPAAQTVGVPMRCVTVDSVGRKRVGADGTLSFEIQWTEALGVSGAAPVVTWGEWGAYGEALLAKWGVADGTVEVRRNLALRPRADAFTDNGGFGDSRWQTKSQYSLLTGIASPGYGITTAARLTVTQLQSGLGFHIFGNSDANIGAYLSVTPGTPFDVSLLVRRSVDGQCTLATKFYDDDNSVIADTAYTPSQRTAVWSEHRQTILPPPGATRLRLSFRFVDSPPVGTTLDATALMIGPVGAPYFDGSYSPDPDLTPSWTGTPNASASVLKVASGWQHYSALDLCRTIAGMPA
jgi:hypothetical protein